MAKPGKKSSPQAKQGGKGNGNNRNPPQHQQQRRGTRSQKHSEHMEISDSGRRAVKASFKSSDDRRAQTKTKEEFQSPIGSATAKGHQGRTSNNQGGNDAKKGDVNSSSHGQHGQQNRVPSTVDRDPIQAGKTEDGSLTTIELAQSRSHDQSHDPDSLPNQGDVSRGAHAHVTHTMTAQNIDLLSHDPKSAQGIPEQMSDTDIADAVEQIDTNTMLRQKLLNVTEDTPAASTPATTKQQASQTVFRKRNFVSSTIRSVKTSMQQSLDGLRSGLQLRRNANKKAIPAMASSSDDTNPTQPIIRPIDLQDMYTPTNIEIPMTRDQDSLLIPVNVDSEDSVNLINLDSSDSHDKAVANDHTQVDDTGSNLLPEDTAGTGLVPPTNSDETDLDDGDFERALKLSEGATSDLKDVNDQGEASITIRATQVGEPSSNVRNNVETIKKERFLRESALKIINANGTSNDYVIQQDAKKLPDYVNLLKLRSTLEKVDIPIEKMAAILQYSGFYPSGELKPRAFAALQSVLIEETHFLIEKAWHQGGGIDLEWATLWEYRSINAQGVMEWCEKNIEVMMGAPISSVTPGDQLMILIAASSMFIADFPLILQDIVRYHYEKRNVKDFKPMTIDNAINMAIMVGEKAFNKYFIKKVKSSWEGNKSPFVRNYQKGQLHKPVPRFLRREDPLQFPDELPLMAKSHMHGRWTQFRNHGKAWMDYPDTFQTHRWFVLPPNVPQDPKHWVGFRLPTGHIVNNMDEVNALVAQLRDAHQLPFNPRQPLGPTPLAMKEGPRGDSAAHDGTVLVSDVADLTPYDDRTPERVGISVHGRKYVQGNGLPLSDVLRGRKHGEDSAYSAAYPVYTESDIYSTPDRESYPRIETRIDPMAHSPGQGIRNLYGALKMDIPPSAYNNHTDVLNSPPDLSMGSTKPTNSQPSMDLNQSSDHISSGAQLEGTMGDDTRQMSPQNQGQSMHTPHNANQNRVGIYAPVSSLQQQSGGNASQREGRSSVSFNLNHTTSPSNQTMHTGNLTQQRGNTPTFTGNTGNIGFRTQTPMSTLTTPSSAQQLPHQHQVAGTNASTISGSMPNPFQPGSVVSNPTPKQQSNMAMNLGGVRTWECIQIRVFGPQSRHATMGTNTKSSHGVWQ